MTVRELIAKLHTFDPDLEVLCDRCSDLTWVTPDEITEIEAVPRVHGRYSGGWLMRVREEDKPTMSRKDLMGIRRYVHFVGN